MKKFIYACILIAALYFLADFIYYSSSFYVDFNRDKVVHSLVKTVDKEIYLDKGKGYEQFEIKGVNLGVGIPGHFATDYAVTKADYLRWFGYISDMGANTIRVYTILHSAFYQAVYEYNKDNDNPLYIIHGLWVNDYIQNSHRDAYDKEFINEFMDDGVDLINVIHGRKKKVTSSDSGGGFYTKDISPWVIGYILGVEWEDVTVVYTDHMNKDKNNFRGQYMYTTQDATPFEAMLAKVGNHMIDYESKRYKSQRLVAFSNWPTTDPFDYPKAISEHFYKIAKVDTEHIKTTENFVSGTFASYHIYPYYPDFLSYIDKSETLANEIGSENTYLAYLQKINEHHSMPVIISEFGIPTSRGMAQKDRNTGRNQGRMSESEQGKALTECYNDIKAAGCAGSIVFSWQDEWFKRTWNTMHAVDLLKTPYWSDYQTNEQSFGLLTFDPGKDKSISYVDGDLSEWSDDDLVVSNVDTSLSIKYDEKFIYFLAYKKDYNKDEPLYIPIDLTPKSGSLYCKNYDINFDRNADFVISIDGKYNSRVVVQERYECLRAMFYHDTNNKDAYENPPAVNTSDFKNIDIILQTVSTLISGNPNAPAETYETGLLTYGNAKPTSLEFNSLADFCFSGDYVEIKLPWQLLNFSNPSEMIIHDDYYMHYGVEKLKISSMYLGIGTGKEADIILSEKKLKGWRSNPTYNERLKTSYYDMQKIWRSE